MILVSSSSSFSPSSSDITQIPIMQLSQKELRKRVLGVEDDIQLNRSFFHPRLLYLTTRLPPHLFSAASPIIFHPVQPSSSQHYINELTCLHVCTVMGQACQLTSLADEMTSIKGIRHGKLLMSRAE